MGAFDLPKGEKKSLTWGREALVDVETYWPGLFLAGDNQISLEDSAAQFNYQTSLIISLGVRYPSHAVRGTNVIRRNSNF